MDINNLHIEVTGDDSSLRELAVGIINKAFVDNGFTNVAMLNPIGEPTVYPQIETMFDIIKEHRPQLFNAPVTIQGSFSTEQHSEVLLEQINNLTYFIEMGMEVGRDDFDELTLNITEDEEIPNEQ